MADVPEAGSGPEVEMDLVEPLDTAQMQKFLNLVCRRVDDIILLLLKGSITHCNVN